MSIRLHLAVGVALVCARGHAWSFQKAGEAKAPPQRFAVVACYGDDAPGCEFAKAKLQSKQCQPKVTVVEAPRNASGADLAKLITARGVPKGTPVFLFGHGNVYPRKDVEKGKGKAEHHIEGVATSTILAALPYGKYGLSVWGASCHIGEACQPGRGCVGGICQANETGTVINDDADGATQALLNLYCSEAEFAKADNEGGKADGVITPGELSRYMCQHAEYGRPHINFYIRKDIPGQDKAKTFAENKAAVQEIVAIYTREYFNGKMSADDQKALKEFVKKDGEVEDNRYLVRTPPTQLRQWVRYYLDRIEPRSSGPWTAQAMLAAMSWTDYPDKYRFHVDGAPLDSLSRLYFPSSRENQACVWIDNGRRVTTFTPHVQHFSLRFFPSRRRLTERVGKAVGVAA